MASETDVTSSNVDFDDEKGFAARVFAKPFAKTHFAAVQKLGLGIAGSFANMEGALGLPQNNGYVTDGQQQFFTYFTSAAAGKPNVIADGDHWRLSPQASWYWGPFSLMGEYVVSSQRLRRTDTGVFGTIDNAAWHIALGYVLTGEDASYQGVVPGKPFDPRANSWGAFEVAVRYARLDIDDDAFPRFADATQSASEAAAWGLGLNWYLNKNLRATVDFFHTDFNGGRAGAVTRQDEDAVFTRLQISF
jgi:phosphate-selective porin OprO/OprP